MSLVRLVVFMCCLYGATYQFYLLYVMLPVPIQISQRDLVKEEAVVCLKLLKAPKKDFDKISDGIATSSKATGLPVALITAVIHDESTFNMRAVSHKGYKGLAQTPSATMKYANVDILHGMMILKEKLEISKFDMEKAMSLYKGGTSKEARDQAAATLKKYEWLKDKLKKGGYSV